MKQTNKAHALREVLTQIGAHKLMIAIVFFIKYTKEWFSKFAP